MEHKLASLEFYTKVHNINEYYPELLQSWRKYVDENLPSIHKLYNFINCNPRSWVNDPKQFIEAQILQVIDPFQSANSSNEDINKFIALLKVYLMEFAYSHHTCNQLKENDNLNDSKTREKYIKSVGVAKQNRKCTSKLLKESKLIAEIDNITMGNNRSGIIGGHMSLINEYIKDYALILYKTEAQSNGKNIR